MAEKGTLELSFEAGQVLKTFGQTGRGGWGRKGIAEESITDPQQIITDPQENVL